ncbi:LytR C-terminal domain-containing protein [Streptomyces sp. NBC_00249]|uniref:LCP family protein n=1 Tax=Streptomyces sp. NBC_00249 TaxID=2975690 RepID=UPI00224FC5BC|nr:LCP family protein [Streptomyces sp. NBC_00249]MCX5198166.1 LytR C-terminal domain-containing protein [Streptomyces sp. NBC_00249]
MTDPQDQYGRYDPHTAQAQQLVGYDPYGRPVYAPVPAQPAPQQYGQQQYQQPQPQQQYEQPYAYEQPQQPYYPPQQEYPQAPPYGYDTQQAQQWIPQQGAPAGPRPEPPGAAPVPEPRREPAGAPAVPQDPDYRTEQFAFIDQPDEDSEDVIDWLAFTESRTERREEARRRGRNRIVALVVVLALSVVGGIGYLWYAGKLPFLDGPGDKKAPAAAAGAQKRDMIVVHLRNTKRGGSSTALLVDNVTTRQGATVLLPNTLAIPGQDGTGAPLGKAVDAGALGTREALDTVLGTRIGGTWRLDTPFLERLVELLGGVEADTDVAVPADDQARTPAVGQGPKQSLTGAMAVAYATYRAPGEPEAKQLERTGKVLQAVLRKIPGDPKAAATTVESMGQILDPGLDAQNLGALLSRIGEHAKVGAYRTELLGVKADGGLTDEANKKVVKELLGGSFTAAQPGAALRVGLKDATGDEKTRIAAKAALLNGGYGFVDGGRSDRTAATSQITYQDDAQRDRALEVAKTLGLAESAVKKAENTVNADVVVTLGKDYKAS